MVKKLRLQFILIKLIALIAFVVCGAIGVLIVINGDIKTGVLLISAAVIIIAVSIAMLIGYGVKSFSYNGHSICTVRGFGYIALYIDDQKVDSSVNPVGLGWIVPLYGTLPNGESVDAQLTPLYFAARVLVNGNKI